MDHPEITQDDLIKRDPILRVLCAGWKLSNARIILLVSVLTGLLFFGVGGIASFTYAGPGKRITAFDNFAFLTAWIILFAPLMWGTFLWQSRVVTTLILRLVKGGSFGNPTSDNGQHVIRLAKQTYTLMTHPLLYLLVVLTLAGFWAIEFMIAWPEQFRLSTEYWYEVRWYLPVHILAWTLSLYPLFLFIYRQVIFIVRLAVIFKKSEVEVKPLDPDECGGLGEVSEFIKTSLLFAIGLGLLAVLFSFALYLNGSNPLHRPDAAGLFAIYISLAPFCLLVPLLSGRGAMLRARHKFLLPIAREFQEVLESSRKEIPEQIAAAKELNERLEQIQRYRDIVLKTYPTMPMSLGALQRVSISATIPLISGVASLVIQLLSNQP